MELGVPLKQQLAVHEKRRLALGQFLREVANGILIGEAEVVLGQAELFAQIRLHLLDVQKFARGAPVSVQPCLANALLGGDLQLLQQPGAKDGAVRASFAGSFADSGTMLQFQVPRILDLGDAPAIATKPSKPIVGNEARDFDWRIPFGPPSLPNEARKVVANSFLGCQLRRAAFSIHIFCNVRSLRPPERTLQPCQ